MFIDQHYNGTFPSPLYTPTRMIPAVSSNTRGAKSGAHDGCPGFATSAQQQASVMDGTDSAAVDPAPPAAAGGGAAEFDETSDDPNDDDDYNDAMSESTVDEESGCGCPCFSMSCQQLSFCTSDAHEWLAHRHDAGPA